MEVTCRLWGHNICDYGHLILENGISKWKWNSLDEMDLDQSQKDLFTDILNKRSIFPSPDKDIIRWRDSFDGKYKVCFGYKLKEVAIDKKDWPINLFWHQHLLPKAGSFAWLACQRKILTQERLHSIGINGPSRCPLCLDQEETVDHLLLHCKFSSHCWWYFMEKLRLFGPFLVGLDNWFLQWPKPVGKVVFF